MRTKEKFNIGQLTTEDIKKFKKEWFSLNEVKWIMEWIDDAQNWRWYSLDEVRKNNYEDKSIFSRVKNSEYA